MITWETGIRGGSQKLAQMVVLTKSPRFLQRSGVLCATLFV